MKFTARIPVTAALLALLLITATGCNRLKARDQLTKGVQAFKNARYEEAVNHFQQSIALDPNYEDAKLYLATAYSYQVVPNLDTPENLAIAQKALDGFNAVPLLLSEQKGQGYLAWADSVRTYSIIGLIVAWQIYGKLFWPIFSCLPCKRSIASNLSGDMIPEG